MLKLMEHSITQMMNIKMEEDPYYWDGTYDGDKGEGRDTSG